MMGFDYEVCYKKGVSNRAVDALSQLPTGTLHMLTILQTSLLDKIRQTWSQDPHLSKLIQTLQHSVHLSSKFT